MSPDRKALSSSQLNSLDRHYEVIDSIYLEAHNVDAALKQWIAFGFSQESPQLREGGDVSCVRGTIGITISELPTEEVPELVIHFSTPTLPSELEAFRGLAKIQEDVVEEGTYSPMTIVQLSGSDAILAFITVLAITYFPKADSRS